MFLSKIISNFTYKNCDLIRGVEDEYTLSLAKSTQKLHNFSSMGRLLNL